METSQQTTCFKIKLINIITCLTKNYDSNRIIKVFFLNTQLFHSEQFNYIKCIAEIIISLETFFTNCVLKIMVVLLLNRVSVTPDTECILLSDLSFSASICSIFFSRLQLCLNLPQPISFELKTCHIIIIFRDIFLGFLSFLQVFLVFMS